MATICPNCWRLPIARVNLNFRWRFLFCAPTALRTGGAQGRRVPLWSIVICGWKFWICLQPLRAYPFPSVACVSPCDPLAQALGRTCRMRIYIFSCSALLLFLLFPLLSRFARDLNLLSEILLKSLFAWLTKGFSRFECVAHFQWGVRLTSRVHLKCSNWYTGLSRVAAQPQSHAANV